MYYSKITNWVLHYVVIVLTHTSKSLNSAVPITSMVTGG